MSDMRWQQRSMWPMRREPYGPCGPCGPMRPMRREPCGPCGDRQRTGRPPGRRRMDAAWYPAWRGTDAAWAGTRGGIDGSDRRWVVQPSALMPERPGRLSTVGADPKVTNRHKPPPTPPGRTRPPHGSETGTPRPDGDAGNRGRAPAGPTRRRAARETGKPGTRVACRNRSGPRIPMTPNPAVAHFVLAATSKSSSSSLLTLLPLVAIGLLGYFFFIRPQQRKAQAARQNQGSAFEVGDEVQTVGGVIGTVLEVHGDRYTLLTGALGDDGNLDGRQASPKKTDPIDDVRDDDEPVQDVRPARSSGNSNGKVNSTSAASDASHDDDIDDVGGDGASSSGDLSGEAEEG